MGAAAADGERLSRPAPRISDISMLACKDGVPPRLTHTVFLQETVGQIDFCPALAGGGSERDLCGSRGADVGWRGS